MSLNFEALAKTCLYFSYVTCIFLFLHRSVKHCNLKKALPGISLRYWEAQCTGAELYSQNYQQSVSGKVSWNDIKLLPIMATGMVLVLLQQIVFNCSSLGK